jgi:uncharacterized protein YktB (UPF0637 family)
MTNQTMIQLQRKIMIKKEEIITALYRHRTNHIKEYALAKKAFKKKALRELARATKAIEKGELRLSIQMVSPVRQVEYFDNVIKMFKSEVASTVELSQQEYNEYVLNQSNVIQQSRVSNSAYFSNRSKGL